MHGCSRGDVHGCSGGHLWLLLGGACMVALGGMRGFCQGGHVWFFPGGACVGYDEIWSMSGRYASYWNAFLLQIKISYGSGMVNSKSFVGKVLLRIKWKFELTVHFKHEMLGK